eukprot:TRINITY_DN46768_c0_g1_i1.p1 TRINITY_DN46768_c0_g1~~TRINITY_DN46768_c0_g1_i1.p1  ORF type:complete len:103 (-),score=10.05 TRINITY_DN46768_c0_g1_i1:137-445(-)
MTSSFAMRSSPKSSSVSAGVLGANPLPRIPEEQCLSGGEYVDCKTVDHGLLQRLPRARSARQSERSQRAKRVRWALAFAMVDDNMEWSSDNRSCESPFKVSL